MLKYQMFNRISLLVAGFCCKFVTRLSAESSSFLWHNLANLGHNHLAKLAVSTIHSRRSCHDANWREHAEKKVTVTQMPCPHTLWFIRCWDVF